MGGPYALYILVAIPHGGIHAIFALLGSGLILFSYMRFERQHKYLAEPILNATGLCCLVYSLVIFFIRSKGYNDDTFEQLIPMASLILFGLVAIAFILDSVVRFANVKGKLPAF